MPRSSERAAVLAGDLTDALLSVLRGAARSTASGSSCVTLKLEPNGALAIERGNCRATAPLRAVSGTWFDGVSVEGRALALVEGLFRPTQTVELIVDRLELVVRGPGFRLCIKRLPNQGLARNRRTAG